MFSMGCKCFPIEAFADEVRVIGNWEANYIWCCVGGFNESISLSNWDHSREKREQREKGRVHYTESTLSSIRFFWNCDTFLCNFASAQYQKNVSIQDEIEEQSFSFNLGGQQK